MTHYARNEIVDILYKDFKELIPKETIEKSLIKFSFISICSKEWLKEHYIEKQLSAREIADMLNVSLGHVQKTIQKYKLQKKKYGITTGNNQAHRRALWRRKSAAAQPHAKKVKIFHMHDTEPIFIMNSISSAAKKIKVAREHVRDCLNPEKQRKSAGGFRFELLDSKISSEVDDVKSIVQSFHEEEKKEKYLKSLQYK